jgi:hypothetical protein
MEDINPIAQSTEPTPVPAEPVVQAAEVAPPVTPAQPVTPVAEVAPTEESFLRKNKMLIIGGIVALIVVTVAVGILLSLKNSEKLEGLIKLRETQTQETHKIPRK